jgi:hypothetical protein
MQAKQKAVIQPKHASPLAGSAQYLINAEQTYISLSRNEDPPSPARSCHVYTITLNPATNRRCQIRHSRSRHAMLRPERGAPMDRLLGSARYLIDTDFTSYLRERMQCRLAAPDLQQPCQLPAHNACPKTLCLLASHHVLSREMGGGR